MTARSFTVAYHRDLTGGCLDWRLYAYGLGHWCVSNGHSGSFRTEAEAVKHGEAWVATGLPPCEQDDARFAAIVEDLKASEARTRAWIAEVEARADLPSRAEIVDRLVKPVLRAVS